MTNTSTTSYLKVWTSMLVRMGAKLQIKIHMWQIWGGAVSINSNYYAPHLFADCVEMKLLFLSNYAHIVMPASSMLWHAHHTLCDAQGMCYTFCDFSPLLLLLSVHDQLILIVMGKHGRFENFRIGPSLSNRIGMADSNSNRISKLRRFPRQCFHVILGRTFVFGLRTKNLKNIFKPLVKT